jgi:hypothetical protein
MTAILNSYSFPKPTATTTGLKLFIDPSDGACFSRNKISFGKDIFSFTSPFSVNNGSQSRDTITSPVGSTPLKMTVTGGDPHIRSYNGPTTNTGIAINSGETWTISFYVKGSITTSGEVFLFGADVDGVAFNNGFYDIAAVGYSVTTEWTRKSMTYTFTNAASKNLQFRFDGPNAYTTTHNLWFDGLQIERGSTITNFNSSNSTTLLTDLSGTGSNGTINGGASLSVDGTHLVFDGVNDYISFASYSQPAYETSTNFTWDTWLNNESSLSQVILGVRTAADLANFTKLTPTNFEFYPNNFAATIPQSSWTNIVIVKNSTTISYYRNQNLIGTLSAPNTKISMPFYIGGDPGTAGEYFLGKIATVKVYDRALTEVEVSQNFNSLRSRFSI